MSDGSTTLSTDCGCPCGASRFSVIGTPVTRLYCHCTICQSVYRQPYADVTVWWAGGIRLPEAQRIEFKRYRLPPALQRGTCASCGRPVVGFLRLAPFIRLAFVPSVNVTDRSGLPAPRGHIFYHRRVSDAGDDLPKLSGYWPSELAVTRWVLAGTMRGAGSA
jgi:hypothetical protein